MFKRSTKPKNTILEDSTSADMPSRAFHSKYKYGSQKSRHQTVIGLRPAYAQAVKADNKARMEFLEDRAYVLLDMSWNSLYLAGTSSLTYLQAEQWHKAVQNVFNDLPASLLEELAAEGIPLKQVGPWIMRSSRGRRSIFQDVAEREFARAVLAGETEIGVLTLQRLDEAGLRVVAAEAGKLVPKQIELLRSSRPVFNDKNSSAEKLLVALRDTMWAVRSSRHVPLGCLGTFDENNELPLLKWQYVKADWHAYETYVAEANGLPPALRQDYNLTSNIIFILSEVYNMEMEEAADIILRAAQGVRLS